MKETLSVGLEPGTKRIHEFVAGQKTRSDDIRAGKGIWESREGGTLGG